MQRQLPPLAAALLVSFTAAVVALSCGGGSHSGSTPPDPVPTPTPVGGAQSCRLGAGNAAASCGKQAPHLTDFVMAAMDRLVTQKPQIFDTKDVSPQGTDNYRVLDKEAYLNGMVANLQSGGLCAQRDPDDYMYEQIQVKNDNSFSEEYDVLLGDGYMWHNGASYRFTCNPASFPVQRSTDLPPVGSGCGRPYPPAVHHFNVEEHIPYGDYALLDSTPIVGPDSDFCKAIGYTDGRSFCPVRQEGSPERSACEAWRVGTAQDTGRSGPTWTHGGKLCTGSGSGCENEPANQYQLRAYQNGTFTACAQNGACGEVQVSDR
ncbi:MAG TPA: hypothetical protein VEQ10_01130 [Vicinamibacteria bacterium]|nr:hypothetical protein [Vicinamibacteria bacterium]